MRESRLKSAKSLADSRTLLGRTLWAFLLIHLAAGHVLAESTPRPSEGYVTFFERTLKFAKAAFGVTGPSPWTDLDEALLAPTPVLTSKTVVNVVYVESNGSRRVMPIDFGAPRRVRILHERGSAVEYSRRGGTVHRAPGPIDPVFIGAGKSANQPPVPLGPTWDFPGLKREFLLPIDWVEAQRRLPKQIASRVPILRSE